MKGDFTRNTFRKEKHYRKVNMQQGRVQMDADWNEQNDIQFHYEKMYLKDLIGKSGTLAANNGFVISTNYSFTWSKIGAPTDSGYDAVEVAGLKKFLADNFGLLWITPSTTFARESAAKLSISSAGHSASIEKDAGTAALKIDGKDAYSFLVAGAKVYGRGFLVGPGNYYVDGILCENEYAVDSMKQPDVEESTALSASTYIAYLDVWERHVTYLDDSYIREQALGDADTATRTKITWQVRLHDAAGLGSNGCQQWANTLAAIDKPTTGTMKARAKLSPESTDRCSLYETAGYTRLENQLYRVEVHKSGNLAQATFKWSRDNGTIVSKITKFESVNKLVIEKRGKDSLLDFEKDGWVEVTDDLNDLHGIPGTLVKLKNVEDTTIEYDLATVSGNSIDGTNYPLSRNPKVRRWESKDDKPLIDSSTAKDADGYVELEYGVQVKLGAGYYRTGDYWLVPARTRMGSVEWPRVGESDSDEPLALLPTGVTHHYAPLALLELGGSGHFTPKEDLRSFFSSLTELVAMHYAGGDGQQALPDNKLPAPLRVSVTLGNQLINKTPMNGAKVRFAIVKQSPSTPGSLKPLPAGTPSNQHVDVSTNAESIAECEWILGENMEVQQVKAELYDKCGNKVDVPPIYFNASLPISFYCVAGDDEEAVPGSEIDLKVGLKIGNTPVASGTEYRVIFSTEPGNGQLTSGASTATSIDVPPGAGGIASCRWTLATGAIRQQAKAVLMHKPDSSATFQQTSLEPIYFNAALPVSFYYIAGDGIEIPRGETVQTKLQVGLKIGNTPVTSGYEVRFFATSGTLSASSVLPSSGIASSVWTLSNINKPEQAWAELYYQDPVNTTVFKPANVAPVYFGAVDVEEKTNAVATTGIAVIRIVAGQSWQRGTFGPFKHYLDVEVPPAVLLGFPNAKDTGSSVLFTEDFPYPLRFKPINITKETFYIQLWAEYTTTMAMTAATGTSAATRSRIADLFSRGIDSADLARRDFDFTRVIDLATSGTATTPSGPASGATAGNKSEVKLRWWAVPAEDKGEQVVEPEQEPTIEFDRTSYGSSEEITLTVTHAGASDDASAIDKVNVTLAAGDSKVPLTLTETGPSTNVYSLTFKVDTRRRVIIISNRTRAMAGLAPGMVTATYTYGTDRSVSIQAAVQ